MLRLGNVAGRYGWEHRNIMSITINHQTNDISATNGSLTIGGASEVMSTITGATAVVAHDISLAHVFYHSGMSTNFIANFTNVPTTNDRTTSIALLVTQGATAYLPTAVQINGGAQTINWANNTLPSGTANNVDVVSFTLIRTGSSWTVVGSLSTFGV